MKKLLILKKIFRYTIPCLRNSISEYSQIKAAIYIYTKYVSILKKVENLSRNKNGKIKLVDISLIKL